MKDAMKEFWMDVGIAVLFVLAIFVVLIFVTGCKTVRSLKKSTSDSTSVSKVQEQTAKKDSSGTKSESTKETVYYPQPIYIKGKDGESKIVFVPQSVKETGKTEQAQVIVDNSWRSSFDSLSKMVLALSEDKKTKVGPSFIEWILIIAVGLLLLTNFLPKAITFINKIIKL